MKNYTIVVTESLRREVIIEANDYMDALNQVENMWKNSEIILTADDWDEVDFREASTGRGWYL